MPLSKKKATPHLLSSEGNGILKCYNMFPSMFNDIEDMTKYLQTVKNMGFNTVWINPIQLTSSVAQSKANKLTGVSEKIGYSLYAMKDFDLFDPRFSVVKLGQYGMPLFTAKQHRVLTQMSDSQLRELFNISSKNELKKILATDIASIVARHDQIIVTYEQKKQDLSSIDNPQINREPQNTVKGDRHAKAQKKLQIKEEISDLQEQIQYLTNIKQKELDGFLSKFKKIIVYFDTVAIRQFTATAKSLGITPIFDLVLNHVAKDADLCLQYPDWFEDDASFPDVKKFRYTHKGIDLVSIFKTVWKPYIKKYMDLGFEGARIDFVASLPMELRQLAYRYMHHQMKGTDHAAIILEELLFSEESVESLVSKVGAAGGTHITCSAFYEKRLWHGGMPYSIAQEQHAKNTLVSQGGINFTGNHDHCSAACTVLFQLARDRLAKDPLFNPVLNDFIENYSKTKQLSTAAELRFIFSYVAEIVAEINKDPQGKTSQAFLKSLFDHFSVNMFAGSAGYYMLSGDEAAFELPSIIGLRPNRAPIYPLMCHPALNDPNPDTLECLRTLATDLLTKNTEMRPICQKYAQNNEIRDRILAPYIEQIKYLINGKDPEMLSQFESLMHEKNHDFQKNQSFVSTPRTADNQWGSLGQLFGEQLREFIAENNLILDHLCKPTPHTHADMFLLNEHITVTVRYANAGFSGGADIIFTNLDPEKTYSIGLKEFKDIANWVQQRCFPGESLDTPPSQGFHDIWHSIMHEDSDMELPVIHMNKGLVIDHALLKQVKIGTQITHTIKTEDAELFKAPRLSRKTIKTFFNAKKAQDLQKNEADSEEKPEQDKNKFLPGPPS